MTEALPEVYADRIPVSTLLTTIIARWRESSNARADRFWSTVARLAADDTREVMEISFTSPHLVNYLGFATAHFPHTVSAQYQTPTDPTWRSFTSVVPTPERWWVNVAATDRKAALIGSPLSFTLADSLPVRVNVNSAAGYGHPQHFGSGHWVPVSWKTAPVLISRLRMVLVRNPAGIPPSDPMGNPAHFSLGIRDLQVGFRVNSFGDVPRFGDVANHQESFASSIDLLGSRVVYSLTTSPATNTADGNDSTTWRSDPQPVNYAVVNFYADTRNALGQGQVIDRFFVDPLTIGCHVNLYHSDDTPATTFTALDTPIGYPAAQNHGLAPLTDKFPQEPYPDTIRYSPSVVSYTEIANSFLQFDPTAGWWLGLTQRATTGPSGDHPWFAFGANVLRQNGTMVEFTTEHGETIDIPLDPAHSIGALFSVAVTYDPNALLDGLAATLSLTYQFADLAPVTITIGIAPITTAVTEVRIGGYDAIDPGASGLAVRALILTEAVATPGDIAAFLADPDDYLIKSDFAALDTHTTDNAVLRQHPSLSTVDNPIGLVGGPGDRFKDMTWTPVFRDYTLKKGFLWLPPTRAKFWCFEFTGLIAEHYESFVPIRRTVQLFQAATVNHFDQVGGFGPFDPISGGSGVATQIGLTGVSRYSDAVNVLRLLSTDDGSGHSPTEVLYANDPTQAARARDLGWVWNYAPWHTGSSAPRFMETGRHVYDRVTIDHRTKMAFFVGLKALLAYRVDYGVDDDTERYIDHFDDDENITSFSGAGLVNGRIIGVSNYAEVISKTLASRRPVRALQFATQQSEAAPLLSDDGFLDDDLGAHWSTYGDAQLSLDRNTREVRVNRGWYARTYDALETPPAWGLYIAMEGKTYGELEGGQSNGLTGGGIDSEAFTPSHSGRIYGAVKVSAPNGLTAPILVQLISVATGAVLSEKTRMLVEGESASFWTGYTAGTATTLLTYGDLEDGGTALYGDLEGEPYGGFESLAIEGDVFVRVVQVGPTTDEFIVKRVSAFDSPVAWDFSVDAGVHWYEAMDIRNNPDGVLSFPNDGVESITNALRWRCRLFRPGASVSALAIRPWYLGDLGSVAGNEGMDMAGPNRSVVDIYPDIDMDPMWRAWDQPIPRSWYNPPTVTEQANLAPGPPLPPPPDAPPVPILGTASDTTTVIDDASAVVILAPLLDGFDD